MSATPRAARWDQGKAAKGNQDCDQLVDATFAVVEGEFDHRGHKDDRMIGVIELDAIAVDDTDCNMWTDGEELDGTLAHFDWLFAPMLRPAPDRSRGLLFLELR